MADLTHIASLPLRIENHVRQRCAWCGVALIDVDLSQRPATFNPENFGDMWGGLNVFPVGSMVRVRVLSDGEEQVFVRPPNPGNTVPEDACGQLPVELTTDGHEANHAED